MKELPPAFRSLPSGGELCEALEEAFRTHRGWVQATGFVEDVELTLAADVADVRRTFRGRYVLAELSGPLGGPYGAVLSRAVGERSEVIAGVLVRARSAGVQALCISAGGAPARVLPDGPSEAGAATVAPVNAGFAKRPLASSFAARVGVTGPAPDDDDEVALPARGDLVQHFAFGLCEVLAVSGDRLTVRDARGQGRIREIASERLTITGPVEHDGRRLFQLERR
jgi:hypothetical protein